MSEPAGPVGSWKGREKHQPPSSTPVWDPLRVWTFQNQIHCKGSKIEIILFSFYLTIPPQIYMSFNSCPLSFGISTYLLALFWVFLVFFFDVAEKGTRLSQNKASLQSKACFNLRLTQADTAVPSPPLCPNRGWAEEEQNNTRQKQFPCPPKEMLWRMLHLFLLFPELGTSWAVTVLCKTPALAEMGTFLRYPHGPEGNFSDMWDPLPLPSRDCPALQPLLLVEHWF